MELLFFFIGKTEPVIKGKMAKLFSVIPQGVRRLKGVRPKPASGYPFQKDVEW
jgi:hypothetical protein